MDQHFDPYSRHYSSLSVKDLLDARDACHLQLNHSSNVFATAIGMYRIRDTDPDSQQFVAPKDAAKRRGELGPRTLENTSVKPWSWPCVLVFVKQWMNAKNRRGHADELIPPFLYLSDGRVVPVCTLEASLYAGSPERGTGPLTFSSTIVGGGYPVLTDVQGKEHIGSIACLTTDGDRYFGLTNQHVAGGDTREVYTVVKGQRCRIGVSAGRSLRKAPFTSLYPSFAGSSTQSNLDIGLIELDDVGMWTAQVFGLGTLGQVMDFDCITATLDWIGLPLVAHGAASGCLEGEVKALFYRYNSLNGTDYVSDFLIGGRNGKPLATGPGDSGTLWCVDPIAFSDSSRKSKKAVPAPPLRYRPLAVEWGGQKLSGPSGDQFTQYALASSVAVACRELDIEVVTDLNAEHTQYWGAVGHYKIAQLAIDRVSSPQLKKFLQANLAQLTYEAATIATGKIPHDATQFVPLADVPDIVWKTNMNRGGKAARPQENWNHYADMDLPGANGQTLSEMCGEPPVIDLASWIDFYKNAPPPSAGKATAVNMGSLPFRVWQIFDAMVAFRKKGDAKRFLCASGILSHYIGDACQPLHSSMHADGLNGAATGVHGTYEEKMVDRFAVELGKQLDAFAISKLGPALKPAKSGYEAAQAAVDLMNRAHALLPPEHICQVYNDLGGGASQAVVKGLWTELGSQTVACISDGIRTLAMLWDAAYAAAGSKAFAGAVTKADLQAIYEDQKFLPSLHLANLPKADFPSPKKLAVGAASGGRS